MRYGVARTDNGAYIIDEWYATYTQAEEAVAALDGNAIVVGASGINPY
jgi:hypothetical protein